MMGKNAEDIKRRADYKRMNSVKPTKGRPTGLVGMVLHGVGLGWAAGRTLSWNSLFYVLGSPVALGYAVYYLNKAVLGPLPPMPPADLGHMQVGGDEELL